MCAFCILLYLFAYINVMLTLSFMNAYMIDADLKEAGKITVVGLISLIGGASLGPESGLAGIGAAIAKLSTTPINIVCKRLTRNVENNNSSDNEDSTLTTKRGKVVMLSGLVAAFATMLPTPACAIMFCVELMGKALPW